MKKKVNKLLFWTPRILTIFFILFLTMFSLDVFGTGAGFWKTLLGFLMHNLPSFVLIIALLISWKYEIVGGVIFILVGVLYVINMTIDPFDWYMLPWSILIIEVTVLIGVLFLIGWFKKKRK